MSEISEVEIPDATSFLYHGNKGRTKTIWVTAANERIPVRKMDDRHLLNTIRFLQRKAEAYRWSELFSMACGPQPRGEMAQDCFENEMVQLELVDQGELLEHLLGCAVYTTMIEEAVRRGLQPFEEEV